MHQIWFILVFQASIYILSAQKKTLKKLIDRFIFPYNTEGIGHFNKELEHSVGEWVELLTYCNFTSQVAEGFKHYKLLL